MKRKLALGHQEFSEVVGNDCIYVDKTEIIYDLINSGTYFFLSRPRRFGKSLLANTIKELFLGNKKLFKGLWIEDKWDWEKTYPVIKISFANIDYDTFGLTKAIELQLNKIAASNSISLQSKSAASQFQELIIKLAKKGQVAIIIDEYDKPIIDYLDEMEIADKNLKILKNFYSILKDADKYIKFLFITGVSKFSKISIFSDLNNLIDITIDKKYSQIVGWNKEEVLKYFPDYIEEVAEVYKDIYPEIMPEIKKWYNGYSWDGKNFVYNPVSLMNFFQKQFFGNYWFVTGTPTFLMKLIKLRNYTTFDLEKKYISTKILDKYSIKHMTLLPLLLQTGYLTIKNIDLRTRRLQLDYPNMEVEEAFTVHLLAEFAEEKLDKTEGLIFQISDALAANQVEDFIKYINILYKNISYNLMEDKESYYHSMFFMIVKMLGFDIEVEIETIDGRIDATVKTDACIYILEFKINQSAQKAIQQIRDKKYALKYENLKKPIKLLGINFDTDKKMIEDYLLEEY